MQPIQSDYVKQMAAAVGFDACGIAKAEALPNFQTQLEAWLSQGYHASMSYMADHRDMRSDPSKLFPGAQCVVSVLCSYNPTQTLSEPAPIARYAYGEDYHEKLKRKLYLLLSLLKQEYPNLEGRPFVDTAPISDKLWAAKAGLGWIGHNTLLIHPTLGSWCNIGELILSLPANHYDTPIENRCGNCDKCMNACSNQAICSLNGITAIDARRCAAYNTIENRDPQLPKQLRLNGCLFGCDRCQVVCPFNQHATAKTEIPQDRLDQLSRLGEISQPEFNKLRKHSALSRINFDQLMRNKSQSTIR
ncbi:MAG: tRNA epoxyqueuosine(34) reductase QueG [Bacteroidales bacterium]|nr:tRNA epoxyqueuosine(34) reductase QueG [Candidatus Colimorpha onthohippi]